MSLTCIYQPLVPMGGMGLGQFSAAEVQWVQCGRKEEASSSSDKAEVSRVTLDGSATLL